MYLFSKTLLINLVLAAAIVAGVYFSRRGERDVAIGLLLLALGAANLLATAVFAFLGLQKVWMACMLSALVLLGIGYYLCITGIHFD